MPTSKKKPGQTGDPLDDDDVVMRLGAPRQSSDKKLSAKHFSPTDADVREAERLGDIPLSVFETSLTSLSQALEMQREPKPRFVAYLRVGDVRALPHPSGKALEIVWDRLPKCVDSNGVRQPGYAPGCEGHAALLRLVKSNRKAFKELRVKLVDLANRDFHPC